jgi:hypothetical protein
MIRNWYTYDKPIYNGLFLQVAVHANLLAETLGLSRGEIGHATKEEGVSNRVVDR